MDGNHVPTAGLIKLHLRLGGGQSAPITFLWLNYQPFTLRRVIVFVVRHNSYSSRARALLPLIHSVWRDRARQDLAELICLAIRQSHSAMPLKFKYYFCFATIWRGQHAYYGSTDTATEMLHSFRSFFQRQLSHINLIFLRLAVLPTPWHVCVPRPHFHSFWQHIFLHI